MPLQVSTKSPSFIRSGIQVQAFGDLYLFQFTNALPLHFESESTSTSQAETFTQLSQQDARSLTIEGDIAKLGKHVNQMEENIALLEENVTHLQEDMTYLQAEVTHLQAAMARAESRIRQIEIKVQRLKWTVVAIAGFSIGTLLADPIIALLHLR